MTDKRDSDFYFEDGNIVLAADDVEEGMTRYFRLHKSLLIKHSPVFADMFTMPSPSTVDQYDGVPLVRMLDQVDALRSLICLLYDPQAITYTLNHVSFTTQLLEPTLLAKKYQVDWICELVASQLLKQWPTTLEGWDAVNKDEAEEDSRSHNPYDQPEWWDGTLQLREFPEPTSSIRLARECDAPAILPFAFFHLSIQPLDYNQYGQLPYRPLPSEDWHRLALARERMGAWLILKSGEIRWVNCGTESSRQCEKTFLLGWYRVAAGMNPKGDLLQAAHLVICKCNDDPRAKEHLCSPCRKHLISSLRAVRKDFAEQLAEFFQLKDG